MFSGRIIITIFSWCLRFCQSRRMEQECSQPRLSYDHPLGPRLDHFHLDEAAISQKICHEPGDRSLIDNVRWPHLFNMAVVHNGDFVAHGHGFFLVMGDRDKSPAELPLQIFQFCLHLFPDLRVQCTEGFIEQKNGGFQDESSGQSNSLPLSSH